MTTIEPTHSCFDDAMEFFELFDMEDVNIHAHMVQTLRLVHGICVSSEGVGYAHGWVEEHLQGDESRADWPEYVVWQATVFEGRRAYFAVERDWFYRACRVKHRTSYRMEQFAALNLSSRHNGPWLPKYCALLDRQGGERKLGSVVGPSPLGFVFADGAEA